MNKMTTRTVGALVLSILLSTSLTGQMIWPGDINNNGIVNGIDLLYWGVANQANGPVRPAASTDWQEQPMGSPWVSQFPIGNRNYAYADVNGDGQINNVDADALLLNFRRNHGTLIPDTFPGNMGGSAPQMYFDGVGGTVAAGERKEVFFSLGQETQHFDQIYGVTFTVNYPPLALHVQNGLQFSLLQESFFNPTNTDAVIFIHNDAAAGRAVVTMVRTNQQNVSGGGKLGRFIFNFNDLTAPGMPQELRFTITDVAAIDKDMNAVGVQASNFSFYTATNGGGCPNTANPVCGSNGVTYLNSCYAEAAGVFDYTPGTCFSTSCINPAQINPDAVCPAVYEPVCGCNGITYTNECAATAAGVVSTTPGPCATNSTCYDPAYVVVSATTTVNATTGAITANCPTTYAPVCGCNGVTYRNACVAEASGITFYTQGTCESACIDPSAMNPSAVCATAYNPVCGCNNVTYTNACEATAAGVTSFTPGACGGASNWCSTATPIQCGDFLPFETTVGAGNKISQYPSCLSTSMLGADKVYVIQKQTAGDLQIGLEIITPGLDLDLFLLSANCSQVTCLARSTTNNTLTNNEGIIYPNAPIGTYYIVVDSKYANAAGAYRLEVSCGYLFCGNAVPLTCGQPYTGTNAHGRDDVSLYTCGNVLNVENNGPEIVHTFTTTEDGPVSISLTGLSANLELFLLRSCDRGQCMHFSENAGTSNEQINAYLTAGTYYVVVDGYNGAVSNYTLTVNCTSACNLTLTNLSATSSGCGTNSGSINIASAGGTPNYLITYSGPLSGSFTTSSNSCTIYYLPPGTYTITKTDANGCAVSGTVTILGGGGLSATLTPNHAVCMTNGSVSVSVSNGQAPYHIYVTGPVSGSATSNTSIFNINNLTAGSYSIRITDNRGCSITQQVTINQSSGNFIWNSTVTPASCGGYGAIHVNTYNGYAPYNIIVSGPVSGSATVYSNSFNIINLPAGTYQVTIEDDNWCTYVRTVVVPGGNLSVQAVANSGVCGTNGSINVSMANGTPNYNITWTGPVNGSATTSSSNYVIPNLPAGSYAVAVTDAQGCSDYCTVTVSAPEGGGLSLNVIPLPGSCTQNGALWIDIYNGTPLYTITWTGPSSGVIAINDNGLDIPNLPCGIYTVTITDMNGCSGSQTVTIGGCNNIDINLTPQNGICGQPGSLLVNVSGGTPTYNVSWTGPVNGQTTANSNVVNLPNLPAGIYSVTVTDANGCTDYAVAQVTTAASNLNLTAVVTNAVCGGAGAITVQVSGGVPMYQISWSGPQNGSLTTNGSVTTIPGLTAGTYTIYVVDGNGCSATITRTIQNTGSNLNVSLVGNNGICSQFGNIGVYVSNGVAPYQISWTGPTSGSTVSNNAIYQIQNALAGTYSVFVTDGNGCATSGTVQISNQNNLNANLVPNPGVCGSNGSILVNITQGSPNYTIAWSGPVSGTATTSNVQYVINGLPSGTYTVVITDANGCSRTLTTTLNNTNGGLTVVTALIYNVCGQYNTIWIDIIGGTPPYTVTWQGGQTGSGTTTTQGFEIEDLPPGTYKVTVVDANGCMDMQQGIIIYPSPVNLFTVIPNNGVCGETGSIQLNINGGTAPYTLSWNGPVSGTQVYNNGGMYVLNNLPGGTYTFTLTDTNGCTETETVVLNTGTPVNLITALIYNVCGQYNTIWLDMIGGTPPYTITWQGGQTGSGTTITQGFEIEDLPPGTYKVTVVDANGCMDMEQNIIIYPAPIDIFTATPVPGLCGDDGKININVIGGTGPYVLTYTGPVSGTLPFMGGLQVLSNVPAGTYTLTLTDANGCTEVETVTVIAAGNPVTLLTALIYNVCGQYNTIWLDMIGGTPPYTITWQGGQTGSGTTNTQGFEIEDLPPGTYKVIVVDANGCMDMQQDIIIFPSPVNIFTAAPVNGVCSGPGSIIVTVLAGTAPYTLTWTGPSNGSTLFNGTTYTIPNLPAGTYTLVMTDANGCTESEVVVVSTGEDGVVLLATSTPETCITMASITAQASGGSGTYQLVWTGPESGSATIGTAPFVINNLPTGNYALSINDTQGCNDSENVAVSAAENDLGATVTPTPGTCSSNGQIAVNISGGTPPYTVSWAGPSSGSSTINGMFLVIPNLQPGNYTVNVLSGDGCTVARTVQLAAPTGSLTLNATAVAGVCGGTGAINLTIAGGSAPYQISWTGAATGTLTTNSNNVQLPNLGAGSYTIAVSSGNCSATITRIVPMPSPNITLTTSVTNAVCGVGGAIQVVVNNAVGSTVVSWSGPQSGSQTISGNTLILPNLPSGTYSITANNGGCTASTQVVVGNNNGNINVGVHPTAAVCSQNGSLSVVFSGGSAPYTVAWSGFVSGSTTVNGNAYTIPNLPAGTYSVTVNSGNCSGSGTATITNSNGNLSLTATPQHGTCLVQPSFAITVGGGTPPYQLAWQGPASGTTTINGNSFTLTNTPAGTYTFTLTDVNGCSVLRSATVNNNSLSVTLTPQAGICGDNGAIQVSIGNGTGPYLISWMGEVDGFATSASANYTIQPLPGSPYVVTVQDANGCLTTATTTVTSGPSTLEVVHSVSNNGCDVLNNIWMDFFNGVGPYTVQWIGPESGTITTPAPYYDIENVPTGTYIIIITDGNDCVDVQQVEVINIVNTMTLALTGNDGSCGGPASIDVAITGGTPWYTITWYRNNQPIGEVDINAGFYTIHNLTAGNYTVRVTDANGCERTASQSVSTPANILQLTTSIVGPGCTTAGSVGLLLDGGQAPYSINWSGQQQGGAVSNTDSYLISGLSGGAYNIQIQDANGCGNTFSVNVPGTTVGNLLAAYSYTLSGTTVTFQNASANGQYQWNFGDGNYSFEAHPTHTYNTPGTYNVCLTVSGSCGNLVECQSITISASANLALLDIGERQGGNSTVISLPVTIQHATNLISLAGSVRVVNGAVATVTGTTPGSISPQFNALNNTFSYFNNTGTGLNVNPAQPLFYLNVMLTGTPGQSTVVEFVQQPLPVEIGAMVNGAPTVIPYTLSSGMATVMNVAGLAGQLATYWGDGIEHAEVSINGPGYASAMMTDENGSYDMPDLTAGMEYTVTADKNIGHGNGLSTYALFIGQRFLLGMNPPQITSPYQIIAGDANCNDAFTTLDLFLIQRLIIGAAESFEHCPSWVFVADDSAMPTEFDAYNVFPYASDNTMMLMGDETANFVGVKVGDILGQANPNNFGGLGDDRNLTTLPFMAQNRAVSAGEVVTLYFTSDAFHDMVSYQFGLQFATDKVEYMAFLPAEASPFHTVIAGDNQAANGALRLSWFSLDGNGHSADGETPLFALRFRALTDIDDWSAVLRLDAGSMLPEAYNSHNESLDPIVGFSNTVTSTGEAPVGDAFELYQNMPNPLRQSTVIPFYLPAASDTELTLHDPFGKVVWQQTQAYPAGMQRVRLDDVQLPAGVYYYTLRAGTHRATRSMVVVK